MGKSIISIDQSHAVIQALANNVDWSKIDPVVMQERVIKQAREAGAEFTLFLQQGCRLQIGGLKIKPVPFDPVQFSDLGQGWGLLTKEHDARNDSLGEVDMANADLVSCLNAGETQITGEEKLKRLKASDRIRYGADLFHALWLDYQAQKENSVLETLYRLKKVSYLDFFGDVLSAPDGDRHVLYLCRSGGRWHWDASWLDRGWRADNLSLVSQVASDPLNL